MLAQKNPGLEGSVSEESHNPHGFLNAETMGWVECYYKSYLDELLAKYTKNDIDLGMPIKVDSPELVLQNGLLDSLIFITEQLGISRQIPNEWIDKEIPQTCFDYYSFQKQLYGNLKEVTINQMRCFSPAVKKQTYPKFFKIICEVQTQQATGEAQFEYYQLDKNKFRFHKYSFVPYDYEKVKAVENISAAFFNKMEQKQYEELFDACSPFFRSSTSGKQKFIKYLSNLKLTGYRQLTSGIKYEDSGLSVVVYYYLPKEEGYLKIAFKKKDKEYVIDDLALIEKPKQ